MQRKRNIIRRTVIQHNTKYKVIITGTYGLAKYLGDYFVADNISAKNLLHSLDTTTIGTQLGYADASIFINCEHKGSKQIELFEKRGFKTPFDKLDVDTYNKFIQTNQFYHQLLYYPLIHINSKEVLTQYLLPIFLPKQK